MRRLIPTLLIVTLAIAGCSRIADSRFNPFNWFQASRASAPIDVDGNLQPLVPPGSTVQVVDTRVLIDQVSTLQVDRTPSGAIVRATGLANGQGQFNAQLVPVSVQNGTLTLAFRIELPPGFQAGGTPASRQVTAARVLTDAELRGIRAIQVQGARNARVSRR